MSVFGPDDNPYLRTVFSLNDNKYKLIQNLTYPKQKTEQKTNKKQISMQATLLQYNSPTCDIYYKQSTQLR